MKAKVNNEQKELVKNKRNKMLKEYAQNYQLYLLLLLPIIYIIVFCYIPMYGAQIAFKKFNVIQGIMGSPWVGFKNFSKFFNSYQFSRVLTNTLGLSIYDLAAGFPIPIILALSLNNTENVRFKKFSQMVTYAPHFISTVVIVGMLVQFLDPKYGIVNQIIQLFGMKPVSFMGEAGYFKNIYVFSNIWQHAGWGTIIYLAALASIDPAQHEAAIVDGASRFQRIWNIDIPGIMPTIITLLILRTGQILNVGFEKALLMQNDLNLQSSEIIQTYVYKLGIAASLPDFSYSAAIGLFNSVVGFILIIIVNIISKKVTETSLW